LASFAALCDVAAEFGITMGLEFTGFSQVCTLEAALAVAVAADKANGEVVLDALHFFRNGGEGAALPSRDLSKVGYVQMCDGPNTIAEDQRFHEAVQERGLPGTGAFPLVTFAAALPPYPVIDVEVPQAAKMAAGVPPLERARLAVQATRRLFGSG
jgi:sugar phosphate isomerase/epimerase